MIRVKNLRLPLSYNEDIIKSRLSRELKINKNAVKSAVISRRSIDARKKDNVFFLCAVDAELNTNEAAVVKKSKKCEIVKPYIYKTISWHGGPRPVVVGFGPAGMFASLVLAQSGAKPIVLERGRDVDSRTRDVNRFWTSGQLDTVSNVQFGEGGAGTFSDGKLTTGTKDFRQNKVLEEFVSHGAPEEILYDSKPHIGTDRLKSTVKSIREEIISLGGQVMFETKLVGFETKDGKVTSATAESHGRIFSIDTNNIILAVGHSARDTFGMLFDKKLPLEAKPFSVGARIEHLRASIDKAQYGSFAGNPTLGAAPYKLNVHLPNGRGVYTFCMCPGGTVVNASSEENGLCVNGMSEYARDRENSNAALLVGVSPDDFGSDSPLAGIEFQKKIEKKAYEFGGGKFSAPVQRVEDFLNDRASKSIGDIKPSVLPSYNLANLNEALPDFVCESMKQAIPLMGRRLKGFDCSDAVLTGVEARSSSPVRILRNSETLECVSVNGLYPCGEGAGYAGGIISAAVDGIKCAEKIIIKNQKPSL